MSYTMRFKPLLIVLAVVGAPGLSMAQESPPAGWQKAIVSTSGNSKTVWLEDRSLCRLRPTHWWSPFEKTQNVSIRCVR
jgi:hypothetical protein